MFEQSLLFNLRLFADFKTNSAACASFAATNLLLSKIASPLKATIFKAAIGTHGW
jgi:hypothetical protein